MKSVEIERFQKRKGPAAEEINFSAPTIVPAQRDTDFPTPEVDETANHSSDQIIEQRNDRTVKGSNRRTVEPSKGRTVEPPNRRRVETKPVNTYLIEVPKRRTKIRRSFDVFEDQKLALDQLQMTIQDLKGYKPTLGEMYRQALDDYIHKRSGELPNVQTVEGSNRRTVEPSNEEGSNYG